MPALLFFSIASGAQTYETKFTRPLSDILNDVSKRFGIRLKYNVDTTGLKLAYADFRVRPYSLEETLSNVLAPFDFKAVKQNDKLYKIKPYEYPRRQPEDGMKLIPYLSSLYSDKTAWEARRDTLRKEVRERLGIDKLLAVCSKDAPEYSKIRKFDGYTVQNFRLKTANGHTVCGSIYAPKSKGKHPLIICPNGHFSNGRYGKVQQQRLATLARMGAICVDYDLWGWGESADEVGSKAHQTPEAHVMQALNGIRILDWMIQRKDVDKTRIGVNGGSLDAKYKGMPLAEAMCKSALEYVSVLEKCNFYDIVISAKSSNVKTMVDTYRLLDKSCDYPLHLGVTEAGIYHTGLVKSAVGIGALLLEGIGDTIRVSLSDDPVREVEAAKDILKACDKYKKPYCEIISCPTCARTNIRVKELAEQVEKMCENIDKPLKVAVMGCVVNGIGESQGANLGVAGGKDKSAIFVDGEYVCNVENDDILPTLKKYILEYKIKK